MGETVKPAERSFLEESKHPGKTEKRAALSDNDVAVHGMAENILEQLKVPNQPDSKAIMTEDLNDEHLQRISSFVADISKANFSPLDDEFISLATIETLLNMVIDLIERDLQESQRLSEETKKKLMITEKQLMENAKSAHTQWNLHTSIAVNAAAAIAPMILASQLNLDPTHAGVIGKGMQSASSLPEGYRQQYISSTQMDKQQASKMTDQERGDNQQIMKRLQDLKALRDQIMQLKLQAARNQ